MKKYRLMVFSLCLCMMICCDKDESLPEWRWNLSFEEIEQYAAAQGRIDDAQLLAALTSSVFAGGVYNSHVDGVWEFEDSIQDGGIYSVQYLFESDSRCIRGIDMDYPPFKSAVVLGWKYDADRKTIVFRDNSGAIVFEWSVIWFSAGRMIARVCYPDPVVFIRGSRECLKDMQYYVGDLTLMTCEEFQHDYMNAFE